jgi:hypothetical protein
MDHFSSLANDKKHLLVSVGSRTQDPNHNVIGARVVIAHKHRLAQS